MFNLPNPSKEDLKDPLFNKIWETIKSWDINIPEKYEGYMGANGSHVKIIYDAIKTIPDPKIEYTEKAYGGCRKCYGKGYATRTYDEIGAEDFGGDGYVKFGQVEMCFCSCGRGQLLRELLIPNL